MLVDAPVGDPFAASAVSGASLIARLPKIWIGYLLAFATLIGETLAVARNPELTKGADITAVPLEIYLPTFVAVVYWRMFQAGSIRFRRRARCGSTSFLFTSFTGSSAGPLRSRTLSISACKRL